MFTYQPGLLYNFLLALMMNSQNSFNFNLTEPREKACLFYE